MSYIHGWAKACMAVAVRYLNLPQTVFIDYWNFQILNISYGKINPFKGYSFCWLRKFWKKISNGWIGLFSFEIKPMLWNRQPNGYMDTVCQLTQQEFNKCWKALQRIVVSRQTSSWIWKRKKEKKLNVEWSLLH